MPARSTSRANQQAFGTAGNTYTMAGIASPASQAEQAIGGGPTHLVTSNAGGDLAAYTLTDLGPRLIWRRRRGPIPDHRTPIPDRRAPIPDHLGRRDDELAEGIAISLAMDLPIFHAGQTFAINVGSGRFDGSNAVGFTAAGIVDKGNLGAGSTVTLYGGVGTGTNAGTVAGKGGMSFGW